MIHLIKVALLVLFVSPGWSSGYEDTVKLPSKLVPKKVNTTTNSTISSDLTNNDSLSASNKGSKRTCCSVLHDAYIIQNSEQMNADGTSQKADSFLRYHFGEGDYVTIIHFGGLWSDAFDGYYYTVNHVYQPNQYQGGSYHGQTTYDAALKAAIDVLSKFNPQRTRISLFSQGLLKLEDQQLVSKFLDAKALFEKKTGCTVGFRCLFSNQRAFNNPDVWIQLQPFKDMCQKMGATPGLGIMNF